MFTDSLLLCALNIGRSNRATFHSFATMTLSAWNEKGRDIGRARKLVHSTLAEVKCWTALRSFTDLGLNEWTIARFTQLVIVPA